jgi:hypothetical protein
MGYMKKTPHKEYKLQEQAFDAFNKELPVQHALGSDRQKSRRENSDIRSVNWKPNVSGWRLTPRGFELGASSGVFPPGTVTFTDIQNIATDKILGRDTAGSGVIEQLGLGAGLSISGGNLVNTVSAYTDEQAQDAIGNNLGAGLSYNDGTGAVSVTLTLASGTYTPTRSAETNLDANVTMSEAQYMRLGNTVTVSGRFTADPTTPATATAFEMTLPVASNLGAPEDVAGVAFCGSIASMGGEIVGVAANDTAKVQWVATDVTSQSWSYTFTYQII